MYLVVDSCHTTKSLMTRNIPKLQIDFETIDIHTFDTVTHVNRNFVFGCRVGMTILSNQRTFANAQIS